MTIKAVKHIRRLRGGSHFNYDGPGPGCTGVLSVDGKGVAGQTIPHTIPFLMSIEVREFPRQTFPPGDKPSLLSKIGLFTVDLGNGKTLSAWRRLALNA